LGNAEARAVIGVTVGDPAGVGPEIAVKALQEPAVYGSARPLVYADRCVLEKAVESTGVSVELSEVTDPSDGRFERGCIDFIDVKLLKEPIACGEISAAGGKAGYAYLNRAIDDALSGSVDGLATAPLNKESLKAAGVPHIDHTAVLRERAEERKAMTLFVVKDLRIFFLTRHISFREIADAITKESIVEAVPLCDLYLRQLGVKEPKLAVAALNPHGGEKGLFGTDEMDVISPAVAEAKAAGLNVFGPVPADSVFHQAAEGRYDGVLSLYHDQGHIAAKTLDFHGTVSLTMGLKFLRTSVDHGTAFDIAGKGIADARGMIEAILSAGKYAVRVREHAAESP
jgi:4-hydroxythreonine-4-phosphate dehydrogenase